MRTFLVVLFAVAPLPAQTGAQTQAQRDAIAANRANYTKFEYMVPVRDGVKLFTSVYIPKDVFTEGKSYPILLQRTPYNVAPYGADHYRASLGPSDLFAPEKFIFVYKMVYSPSLI